MQCGGDGRVDEVLTLCNVEEAQTQHHQQAVLAHLRCGPLATGSATHTHTHTPHTHTHTHTHVINLQRAVRFAA